MMPELSLNILDIAQNSVKAGADLIEIDVKADTSADRLTVRIKDNGCGMTKEQVEKVTDPFYTTRTTRNVGLGVPFFKLASEAAGGEFRIDSEIGKGTEVYASFCISNIDRMPLGDINGTILTLIKFNTAIDFIYTYSVDGRGFQLDTREIKEILGGVRLDEPEIYSYLKEYLSENKQEADGSVRL